MRRLGITLALAASLALPARAAAIVGGAPVTEPFPSFAELLLDGQHQCGASLVRPQWIVTAAHCVVGQSPASLSVIVGATQREHGEQIPAVSFDVNPGFSESIPVLVARWDTAVVQLAHPVAAPLIRIVDEESIYKPGTIARTIGFGADGFIYGSYRDVLYGIDEPIASDDACNTVYAGRYDPEEHICAGDRSGSAGTCQGDSGGPLMVRDHAGAWELVGTTSFGIGCATPQTYDVFARVAGKPLRTWIEQHLPPLPAPEQPTPAPAPAAPAAPQPAKHAKPRHRARKKHHRRRRHHHRHAH